MPYTLKSNTIPQRLVVYNKEFKTEHKKAFMICAIQFITNISTGIEATPPVLSGNLRGSGSVFIGNEFVKDSQSIVGEKGTPATSNNINDESVITIMFNTPYAAKMHEWTGGWGERTKRAGNAGNKYIEKHLKKDAQEITKLWASLVSKGL